MQSSTLSPFTTKNFCFSLIKQIRFPSNEANVLRQKKQRNCLLYSPEESQYIPRLQGQPNDNYEKDLRRQMGPGGGCQVGVLCPRSYSVWFTRMIYIQKMYFHVFYFRGTRSEKPLFYGHNWDHFVLEWKSYLKIAKSMNDIRLYFEVGVAQFHFPKTK